MKPEFHWPPASDNVGAETLRAFSERVRQPLPRDDYFRLLGAFDERTRIRCQLAQELNLRLTARNRIPGRHFKKWHAANLICEPLRTLLAQIILEQDRMREAIQWETEHGNH